MNSIFHYPGAKSRSAVQQRILSLFPRDYQEYREPFVGGGGIFFGVPSDKRRWVNDLDHGLMAVYQALATDSEAFLALCRSIETFQQGELLVSVREGGKARISARLRDVFDRLAADENADPALRYFFVNRHVWLGRVRYDHHSRLYFSDPNGWSITRKPIMAEAAKRLQDVRITSQDYSALLSEPGEGVLIYCDPPYMSNTQMKEKHKMYDKNFVLADHARFAEAARSCPHDLVVSYDDHPLIRELFVDPKFTLLSTEWAYTGLPGDAKKRGQELVILNFDPARCRHIDPALRAVGARAKFDTSVIPFALPKAV